MQFIHAQCNGSVFADITELIRVLAAVTAGKTVMRVQSATVSQVALPDKSIPMKWYCTTCGCNVPTSEVTTTCDNCGTVVPAEAAIKSSESGGVYCAMCAERLLRSDETRIPLGKSIIKKLSLNPVSVRS